VTWSWKTAKEWYEAETAAENGQNGHETAPPSGGTSPPPPPPPSGGTSPPPPPPPPGDDDDTPPGDQTDYIIAGVRNELAQLRATRQPGRNIKLYISAKCLGKIATIDRAWLRGRLKAACEANGLTPDDGIKQTEASIRSGFAAADAAGPRIIPDDPSYFVHVVSLEDIGFEEENAASAGDDLRAAIFAAEQDFWDRPSLAHIKDAALMRMTPPWAVLCNSVARALYLVPPHIQLPAIRGGVTSLNWFGAAAAVSAGGKSSSRAVARELVLGIPASAVRNLGSGEGLVAQYRPPGRNPRNESRLIFKCEEVDTLVAMNDRQASTTMSVLRDAFMGDSLSLSYVKTAGRAPLEEQEYRMTLVLGVQPGRAGGLINEPYGGTVQRFMWFPAFDPRCTKAATRPGEMITALDIREESHWVTARIIDVPQEVVDEILTVGEMESQGLVAPLDGHMMLVRLKFAFGLAVLDDRIDMDMEDWRLAGIAIAVSEATRNWVTDECRKAEEEMAKLRGRQRGVERSANDAAKAETDEEMIQACGRLVLNYLRKAGLATRRELHRHCGGKYTRWLGATLNRLEAADPPWKIARVPPPKGKRTDLWRMAPDP
jgi:hypothetical protein